MAVKSMLSRKRYTKEQKIVTAVWYHEKIYTGLTNDDILYNFRCRFKMDPPQMTSVMEWEKKLFSGLRKKKMPTGWTRLIYVPYVFESFVTHPDLTMQARSELLGMSKPIFYDIMKYDMDDYKEALKSISSQENQSSNVKTMSIDSVVSAENSQSSDTEKITGHDVLGESNSNVDKEKSDEKDFKQEFVI